MAFSPDDVANGPVTLATFCSSQCCEVEQDSCLRFPEAHLILHLAVYPGQEFCHFGVHAGFISLATACAPAGDSCQIPALILLADQGAPTVSLAGVSASVEVPSTHHPWGKVTVIDQVAIALPEVDEVDLHLPEEGGCLLICFSCLAKACDPAGLIEAKGLSMHREAGRVDVSRQGQGLGEPYEGNVIVILLISVVAIDDDLGNRGCLRQLVQVVSACIHLPALQDLLPGHKEAMGSSEHPLGVDQRAPTNVGGAVVQTDLPRPLALWGQCPSHDPPCHGPQSTVGTLERDILLGRAF